MNELKTKNEEMQDTVYNLLKKHYPEKVLDWVKDATWTLKTVPLDDINMSRRPGGRNMDKVKNIAQAIRDGKPMEPVVLVEQSTGQHQVADGYHRTLGFQKADKDRIRGYVASGLEDDGPWDEEMHANKLNVEPGKKANAMELGLAKLALATSASGKDMFKESPKIVNEKQRIQQVVSQSRTKTFQDLKRRAFSAGGKFANQYPLGLAKLADEQDEMGILGRLGLVLGTTGLGAGAGYLVDRKMKSSPIAMALGGLAGLTMGATALGAAPTPDQVANGAMATMILAQHLQDLRKSYSPEVKATVEEKRTTTPTPDTTARKGIFTTKDSLNDMSKSAEEKIELSPADRITGTILGAGMGLGGLALARGGLRKMGPVAETVQVITDNGLKDARIPTSILKNSRGGVLSDATTSKYLKGDPDYTGITFDDHLNHWKNHKAEAIHAGLGGMLALLGANSVYNSAFHHPDLTKQAFDYIDLRFSKIATEVEQATESPTPHISTAPKPAKTREYYLSRVSKKEDKEGWYAYTHRARSKSYPSVDDIPISVLKFIESSG